MSISSDIINQLEQIFSDNGLLKDPADCWAYGYDNSKIHHPPELVALPQSHQQIVDCVACCNKHNIPLTTRGRGTGTTGASVPLKGGIVLSLERMNEIIDFDAGNRTVRVQTGITNRELQNFLQEKGYFWAPDPSSADFCTIGGNLACNAAGPRAVKYGTTRDNTLQLKAISGEGKSIVTGTRTSKGVVGLDLTRLIIGSEGTLAIITEAELKILPLSPRKHTIRALYKNFQGACDAILNLGKQIHTPCAIEFIDHHAMGLIREYENIDLPQSANAMLMIEVDGDEATLAVSTPCIESSLKNAELTDIKTAKSEQEKIALWSARKALSPILRNFAPDKINEDVVVPIPNLGRFIEILDQLSKQYQIPIVNFGHAGNGNLHVNLLYDAEDSSQNINAHACLEKIFSEVLRLGGTLSGEHGVGIMKRDFISSELGENEIDLMRKIKDQFDPNGILNPEKGLPLI
ncbi:MAG: FAD-linked oxidase C-terminal domain-containing protein [Pseudomonadota bacterium]